MKKFITLLLLLLANKVIACSCIPYSLVDRVVESDFIATVNVLKIKQDKENDDYYTVRVEIMELFKGPKVSSLKIINGGTCAIYTPKKTKWLIFARKNNNGDLVFGYCSGAKQMDKKFGSKKYTMAELDRANNNYIKSLDLKLKFLNYYKNKAIELKNEFALKAHLTDDYSKKLQGFDKQTEHFALYELTIKKDLTIEKVIPLKEFSNNRLSLNLLEGIQTGITIHRNQKDQSIPHKSKMIIVLYYYPSNEKRKSFVGQRAL